jgi:FtsP/CotA-like multicopper oxidase with cupredoxin domain
VVTFNGTIPGPAIVVDWGDDVVVHVTNNLQSNGTTVHWHGMRQLENSEFDGVPGVTQCPIAPGDTLTYKFSATQYGTTWYHSHFILQYGDGLVGPLIINGPATANYDEDLGVIMLQDWGHKPASELWPILVAQGGGPPTLDNTIINGTNTFNCTGSTDSNCLGTGVRFETTFVSGTKYRMRIINTAVDAHFRFSIDGHTLQVIGMDLVPIVPYNTSSILVSIGQRYDIIVNANATANNYWLRATWQTSCSNNKNAANSLGIIRYDSSSSADPTSTSTVASLASNCNDEALTSLVPYVGLNVGADDVRDVVNVALSGNLWTINSTSLEIDWSNPTTLMVYDGESPFPTDYNVVALPTADDWFYLVITSRGGPG